MTQGALLPTNGPAIAAACLAAGLHPVRLSPPRAGDRDTGKSPHVDGGAWWARAAQPRPPADFEGYNVGVACGYPLPDGGHLLVLDPDGDEGVAQLRELAAAHGLPETFTVRSGSGAGYHLYFRTPEPLRGRNLASAINTRARGGQVVAPGNYHHSGGVYEVVANVPIADAPAWLIERLTAPAPAPTVLRPLGATDDAHNPTLVPAAQAALAAWLNECATRTPDPDAPRRNWYSLGVKRLGAMSSLLGGADALWRQVEGGILEWCARRDAFGKADTRDRTNLLARARDAFNEGLSDPSLVSEELADRRDAGALLAASASAAPDGTPPPMIAHLTSTASEFTEHGFAERFAALYGHIARFVPGQGWYTYTGLCWQRAGKPTHAASEMLHALERQVADDEDLAKYVKSFRTHSKLAAICKLAEGLGFMQSPASAFDSASELLNAANGTIDLRTGALRPHAAVDLLTRVAPLAYDPNATCPRWLDALALYLDNDRDAIAYLQRLLGAGLIGRALDMVHFFLGRGLNGKSVVVKVAAGVLGPYSGAISPDAICKRRGGVSGHTSEVGSKIGTRLLFAEELRDGASIDMEAVKRLGGLIHVQPGMGRDFVDVRLTNTLIVTSNHTPSISDTSKGALRRVRVVPFAVDLEERGIAPDHTFVESLLASEGAGIFAWLVAGARAYLAGGLGSCKIVETATAELSSENDLVQAWIDDCCTIGETSRTSVDDLYRNYDSWCRARGQTPIHRSTLSEKLKHKGFAAARDGRMRTRIRVGIGLRPAGVGIA